MAYADRSATGSRVTAAVIVAVILFITGYAFVTGLAMNFVKKAAEKLNTFDVAPPPPPPPDVPPPPPPPDQKFTPPPVVTPPPIVQTPQPAPPIVSVPYAPPVVYAPPAPPAPAPAPPAPPHVSQAARSKGDPHGWYSNDDYPAAALRASAEGRVVARLSIGTDGRVSGCTVTSGSGNEDLDSATCRVAQRRGRYTPARDENGNPIAASDTISIRWVVPKD